MFYQNVLQKCPKIFKLDTEIHGVQSVDYVKSSFKFLNSFHFYSHLAYCQHILAKF